MAPKGPIPASMIKWPYFFDLATLELTMAFGPPISSNKRLVACLVLSLTSMNRKAVFDQPLSELILELVKCVYFVDGLVAD